METNTHFWSYLAQFFLEWETFQIKVKEEIKTRIFLFSDFFLKSCLFLYSAEKYYVAGQDRWQYDACALRAG
jgi:hypothetical protein